MSEEKPPRWKSEVAPREPEPEASFKIDTGNFAADQVGAADVGSVNVGVVNVGTSSGEDGKTESTGGPTRKHPPLRKPVPKQAIMIGIAGGAVLGSLLAWGVLSIVWWRRDVNREADFEAEVKAQRQEEIRRKQAEINDAMRQFSTRKGNP